MRISDWSSDVCSSDLARRGFAKLDDLSERVIPAEHRTHHPTHAEAVDWVCREAIGRLAVATHSEIAAFFDAITPEEARTWCAAAGPETLRRIEIEHADGTVREVWARSEEHTSELQSLMRISYAVFCLKKKK